MDGQQNIKKKYINKYIYIYTYKELTDSGVGARNLNIFLIEEY